MSDNRTFDDLEFFSDISECCSSELEMKGRRDPILKDVLLFVFFKKYPTLYYSRK